MRIIGLILLLGLFSIIIHTIVQIILASTMSFEYLQETRHWFIISTMFVIIICMYFLLRRWNNNTRPQLFISLIKIFFVQVITIVSLSVINIASAFFSTASDVLPDTGALAFQFDPTDFMAKTLIFAVALPIIAFIPIYLVDKKIKRARPNSK